MKTNEKTMQHSGLRCGRMLAGTVILAMAFATQASAATSDTFTFTKLPGPPTYIQAGTPDLEALIFEMDCNTAKSTTLERMDFDFIPSVPPIAFGNLPSLLNFRLVYFPNGLKHSGTIIGFNDGATFTGSSISIDVPSFILSKHFKGQLALILDVNNIFTTSYPFAAELADVTINVGGVDQPVLSFSLPLTGDTFNVVQN